MLAAWGGFVFFLGAAGLEVEVAEVGDGRGRGCFDVGIFDAGFAGEVFGELVAAAGDFFEGDGGGGGLEFAEDLPAVEGGAFVVDAGAVDVEAGVAGAGFFVGVEARDAEVYPGDGLDCCVCRVGHGASLIWSFGLLVEESCED